MLNRKKPLERGGPLKRTRMKPRNEERAAKRRAECFGEQAEACRRLPCCICASRNNGPDPSDVPEDLAAYIRIGVIAMHGCDPHHEPPRSVGGKDGDTVPLCRTHHEERHRVGRSAFERVHNVDLRAVAKAIREELAKSGGEVQDV